MGLLTLHMGWAQQKTITGTVKDETGSPLPGATVIIEGTSRGVAIPTRWLYPQSERELNPNTPDALLTYKVDWDTN
ncbi:MAG: hypothetical protein ACPGC8_02145 [Flavobacteriaceae bacterium]